MYACMNASIYTKSVSFCIMVVTQSMGGPTHPDVSLRWPPASAGGHQGSGMEEGGDGGEHKKIGMVNIISKICLEEGCAKIPSFNNPCEKQGV
mgnify:CR=1 FL=1